MDPSELPSRSRTFEREGGRQGNALTRTRRPQSMSFLSTGGREEVGRDERHGDHQNCVPANTYDDLWGRKEIYKKDFNNLAEDYRQLESENKQLQHRLDQIANQSHRNGRSSEKDGPGEDAAAVAVTHDQYKILYDNYKQSIAFLQAFKMKDLNHAAAEWNKDIKRLTETEAQLKRLQEEILTTVDRFDPNFDSKVFEKFKLLNGAVGRLSKAKELTKLVLADPLLEWDASVLWKHSFEPSLTKEKLPDGEKKLLLRQAIWKFLSGRLFDRSRPLASYGGSAGELAARFSFDKLFPNHGKWRSATVRQLNTHPESENDKQTLRAGLARDFAKFVYKLLLPPGKIALEDLERAVTEKGDLGKRLDEVINRAISLSRLLMGERAAFALVSPPLNEMGFKKGEDDDFTTALGHTVGVVDGSDVETDQAGSVRLVGSPMLIKYGDAGGENLDQKTVVVRAFVVMG